MSKSLGFIQILCHSSFGSQLIQFYKENFLILVNRLDAVYNPGRAPNNQRNSSLKSSLRKPMNFFNKKKKCVHKWCMCVGAPMEVIAWLDRVSSLHLYMFLGKFRSPGLCSKQFTCWASKKRFPLSSLGIIFTSTGDSAASSKAHPGMGDYSEKLLHHPLNSDISQTQNLWATCIPI